MFSDVNTYVHIRFGLHLYASKFREYFSEIRGTGGLIELRPNSQVLRGASFLKLQNSTLNF